jgi:hypothetical protein
MKSLESVVHSTSLAGILDDVNPNRAARDHHEEAEAGPGDSLHIHSLPGCTLRAANCLKDRRDAWRLAYQVYLQKGYTQASPDGYWYGRHDALPGTVTFLAEDNGRPAAAVTVVFDSPWKLPADEIAGAEIENLRSRRRRPCELVSLVSLERGCRGAEIVKHLFKLAWIAARHISGATDFVITVNPRHVSYYTQVLLFERLGATRSCPRVKGAPADLLRLDLLEAEARYAQHYGELPDTRNLYRFFIDRVESIRAWMLRHQRQLSADDLADAFLAARPLITESEFHSLVQQCA